MSTYAGHRVLTANLIKIVIFILFYNNTPSCCLLDSWLLQIHHGSRDLTTLVRAAGSNVWISKSMPQLFIKAFNVSLFHLFFFRSTASLLAWINLVIEYFLAAYLWESRKWAIYLCSQFTQYSITFLAHLDNSISSPVTYSNRQQKFMKKSCVQML